MAKITCDQFYGNHVQGDVIQFGCSPDEEYGFLGASITTLTYSNNRWYLRSVEKDRYFKDGTADHYLKTTTNHVVLTDEQMQDLVAVVTARQECN